jgi:ferrous iron transport protein B
MELPAYHMPSPRNVLRSTMERGWDFVKRALTIVLLSSVVLWFLQTYGFVDGAFTAVEDANTSLLAAIGNAIAWIFYPLGWMGDMAWKSTVATFTGLIAKEQVVMTFGTLYNFAGELSESGDEIWALVASDFGPVTAYSFMIFQLLCAPCFAAIGAIRREMGNVKWTAITIGYMCGFAYAISMIVYQIGGLLTGEASFSLFTIVAFAVLAGLLFLLLRKGYTPKNSELQNQFAVDHM